ncbi:hypothetical protein OpiT1DRAFT_04757 [Opitutaceae bacterium TAV1]|nr:hypothetical protein OpiT1DRAFT_04757 [Opitutaceae bacterium TAV1]
MLPISGDEYDRLFDEGKSDRYLKYFEPISDAELLKNIEMSKTPGRLEAYLKKKYG